MKEISKILKDLTRLTSLEMVNKIFFWGKSEGQPNALLKPFKYLLIPSN